ncbi:hypothetical protein V500_08124 [Pseudogymnoascus sp. VKM F-4518 (FW-2643)]|nr:hypothetical protein V500_08124 [Pseudogymnoascus sp. VKM F-4518 (FW-2643)]
MSTQPSQIKPTTKTTMATHQTHQTHLSNTTKAPHSPLSVTPLARDAQAPILSSPLDDTSTDPHSAVFKSQPEQLAHRTADEGPGGKQDAKERWKPKYGRKQSWDQQDWKRVLQMSEVGDGDQAGFSEKNNGAQ